MLVLASEGGMVACLASIQRCLGDSNVSHHVEIKDT